MKIRPDTYHTWMAMRRRCLDRGFSGYGNYGGRGITVCDRWRDSFAAFITDMGHRPPGTTLDRRDNDRGYEPGNCRWATREQQNRNRRSVQLTPSRVVQIRWLCEGGMLHKEIARAFGVSAGIVAHAVYGTTWASSQPVANLRRRRWSTPRRASA